MLTKTKIVVASILILGSASVANAEDPEVDVYHLANPSRQIQPGFWVGPYQCVTNLERGGRDCSSGS
jgi:hypothetical protein